MKTLREEIRDIRCPKDAHAPSYLRALETVIALIDKRVDDNVNAALSKPQDETLSRGDERPARAKVAAWSADKRNGDESSYVLAIVEAIDANTAALRSRR